MKNIPLFKTEQAIPSRLGELNYAGMEVYEDSRLGVRLRYSHGIIKADAYLYNFGIPDISNDIRSEQVMQFFQQACNGVLSAAKRGMYLDLETRASQYLHIPDNSPDPMYLWAAFYYRQAPGPGVEDEGFPFSLLSVRTDGGYVSKIRYTYPERLKQDAAQYMIRFLFAWYSSISRA